MGDYAATGDLATDGYARTGGGIRFDGAFFPNSYFGIGATFSLGSNYALGDSLRPDIVEYIRDNSSGGGLPPDAEIYFRSGFWNYANLFIGPHFSVRASQRLYFDFRILGGMSFIRLPQQELQVEYNDEYIYSRSDRNKLSLGFSGGAALRFQLSDDLALRVAADYMQTGLKTTYDFSLFTELVGELPPLDAAISMRCMEYSLGLAYSF